MSLFLRLPELQPLEPSESGATDKSHIWVEQKSIKVKLQLDGHGAKESECEDFYIGVGLAYWGGWITDVAKGGPADLAGIQINDVWLNWKEYHDRMLEMGETMILHIKKSSGVTKQLHVRVDKICESKVQ